MRSAVRVVGAAVGEMLAAAIIAAIVAAIGLFAFGKVEWPAFNSSNVLRAVTTVGQVGALVALGISVLLYRAGRWPWIARLLSWAGLSAYVTVTLGMPLAATKLYLHGITADQEFRTEFLTRLTDSPALRDMTYPDMAPYYPAGWFWIGGRVADVLGLPGWAAFKPFAVASIAVAAVLALVLWNRLIRSDWAVMVSVAVTAMVLAYNSPEPYGAVLTVLIPPVLVLAWGALNRDSTGGGWGAAIGTGAFVGLAGSFYTLYFGVTVLMVCAMALVAAYLTRQYLTIFLKLVVIGTLSAIGTGLVWAPYLIASFGAITPETGSATHYLPDAGARLSLPMLSFSLVGILCMFGTVWLFLRVRTSRRAQSLAIGIVVIYLWTLASMTVTVIGRTLLSFRLEPVLIALLAAAGVFGFLEFSRSWAAKYEKQSACRMVAAGLAGLACLSFTQGIPSTLDKEITMAYTDTDGDGHRADRRAASATTYYAQIDSELQKLRPGLRRDTVVLTADTSFLSYYPYLGFQALTSHYANPLSEFAERAKAIESWSKLTTPTEIEQAWAKLPWRAPDAILFRYDPNGYTLRLAEDVYPNNPNVKRYTVSFDPKLFESPDFTVERIGPFVLVVRKG
ncbi:MAG: galactan 5-O-arabinofuranosyltransferase [Nocardiaceae bacterium]|nr:galactan 5-O-arabinofuranosyltransferase [Nocardiaceae bacterium]